MPIPKSHHFAQQPITTVFPKGKQRDIKHRSKETVATDTGVVKELVQFSSFVHLVFHFSAPQWWDCIMSKEENTVLLHIGQRIQFLTAEALSFCYWNKDE